MNAFITMLLLTTASGTCILAGALGWWVAAKFPALVGAIMLFSSGGILYLLFQDIAPQSRLERHWGPTLGAVLGFCFAMLAETVVAGH